MASANEKKRRRPLSSPGMSSALECLTALISRFPEVDCTKLHTGYVCSDRLQTLTNNLQSALAFQSAQVEPGIVVQPWNCPCVYGYRCA